MPYDYTLKHTPGKQLFCTDALSRAPLPSTVSSPAESRSLHEYVGLVLEAAPVAADDIRCATADDPLLSKVMQHILTCSWHNMLPSEQPFYMDRDQLTVTEGIIMMSAHFVIADGLRSSIMALAHEGHPGLEAFHEALRQHVWWPDLTKDAALYVE